MQSQTAVLQQSLQSDGIGYAQGRFVALDEPVIPIDDRAHQFGDGIYEVVRVYHGKPFLVDYHLERFERSAKALRLPLERAIEDLRALIFEAIARSAFSESQVYFQLSRGIVKRDHAFPTVPSHLSLTVRPVQDEKYHTMRQSGQMMMTAEDIRWKYCYIKSLNLLANVMAKQTALDAGVNDAIFVRQGVVTEGTSSNLAIVSKGEMITHPADEYILHGVTRRAVLEIAQENGISVREEHFSVEALLAADEVFTMSSLTEIAPVVQVDGRSVGLVALQENSVVRLLQSAYKNRILRETSWNG